MAFSESSVIKISELRDAIYPVGSIYLSINNTNPKTFFGGEWELLPEGYALWTCSSNGGSTISAGLPNIKGGFSAVGWTGSSFAETPPFSKVSEGNASIHGSSGYYRIFDYTFNASSKNSIYSDNVKTVQPPAYRVYAWRRKE